MFITTSLVSSINIHNDSCSTELYVWYYIAYARTVNCCCREFRFPQLTLFTKIHLKYCWKLLLLLITLTCKNEITEGKINVYDNNFTYWRDFFSALLCSNWTYLIVTFPVFFSPIRLVIGHYVYVLFCFLY